ncbi:DUF1998 domain-containing protein [Leucothrix arctica]|uniref:Sulfate ABC transporter substrate-binding protein n=1 Tax=Leucothrix arctica TaxID=1481894 RepID=A0A317C4J3_9GAMM|nr:DUF1998 domain-containing protein [Leucothrix arctica]PWQ93498.1 sulfate ABC transporter substrate-binding protein [Leucothrix arctica]
MSKKFKDTSNITPVGEVRPTQLLWTYGPGALIDMPSLSVVTLGIDRWEKDRCPPIVEARLLAAVQKVLGSQVETMRMPPFVKADKVDPWSAEARVGVPVRPFPRWLRCVKCGMLAEYDSGLFKVKESRYRPENTRFVHQSCCGSEGDKPARDADAVPARFLLACRNGHLDDFPWRYYVHGGQTDCTAGLRFFESGASLQTENLWIKCDGCDAKRNMAQAFGKSGKENLPACRGRHPHLDRYDSDCDEEPRGVLLGATNSWFPITLSALAIPLARDPIIQLVQDGWDNFVDVESLIEVKAILKVMVKNAILPGISAYTPDEVWAVVEAIQNGDIDNTVTQDDIKGPEWDVFIEPNPPTDWPHFLSESTEVPASYKAQISNVLLLKRLREVNALIGFTRVEAPEESNDPDEQPPMAALCNDTPDWIPASQVHGEGVFIRFAEDRLKVWEEKPAVKALSEKLFEGHQGWRNSRKLDPDKGYPGIRYVLLHTLSHLLIRELALECGYNAASIRERIYADTSDGKSQAGILIYTAAADSDGTLGGLVELGKPDSLGRLLDQAINRAKICSSDPLCSEHEPQKDRTLHAAACHACAFAAETSCERGNLYLDRALVVATLDNPHAAFFNDLTNE